MALLTKFPITVEVDGKTYAAVASELNDAQRKALDAIGEEKRELQQKQQNIALDIQLIRQDYAANETIMRGETLLNKIGIARDQKALNGQLREAVTEGKEVAKAIAALPDVTDEKEQLRFDMMLADGEGKTMLAALVEKTSLTYLVLNAEIRSLITKAREKK